VVEQHVGHEQRQDHQHVEMDEANKASHVGELQHEEEGERREYPPMSERPGEIDARVDR
jgi:hypothetical protein